MSLFTSVDQVVLAYGNEDFLKKFAKKGSETDIRYYNQKIGGNSIAYLYPFKFPERIQPLLNAASVAKKAILSIDSIDKNVGEFILAVDYFEVKELGIIGNDDIFNTLTKVTKGMEVKLSHLQEDLGSLENFLAQNSTPSQGKAMVVIDQSFLVKGVGTVLLGFVISGDIRKHMTLKAYPSGKNVEIRSIQIMDVDYDNAVTFSRVGLAVKNVEPDEVSKGSILFEEEGIEFSDSVRFNVRVNPTVKVRPQLGEKIQLNFLFNNINAEISDMSDESFLIDIDKKIPLLNVNYVISSLNSVPRISGVGKIGN